MIDVTFKSAKKLTVGSVVDLIKNGGGMKESIESCTVSKIEDRNIYLMHSDKIFNYNGEQINEDSDTRFRIKCKLNLKGYSI